MILGSWSGMRRYLEQEMLSESLKGRIRYGCTTYKGMDGFKIFQIFIDGRKVKQFSIETVNTFFINNGYKNNSDPYGKSEYWEDFWIILNKTPLYSRTEYTDEEFCKALEAYRNRDAFESLGCDNPIIRMFAVLDRRIGKRTLSSLKSTVDNQPEWLKPFYLLRMDAEGV